MKTKTLALTALGLLVVLGVGAYATGNLGSLQGRFTTSGNALTVDVSASTPRSDIVVGGQSAVPFSTYTFTSTSDDIIVGKLAVAVKGTEATAVDMITLEYEDSSGATVQEVGYVAAGKVAFTGLDFLVPGADSVELKIYGDIVGTGMGAWTSGDKEMLALDTTGFEAINMNTGLTYATWTFSKTTSANPMFVYATKPTLSLDADSPTSLPRSVDPNDEAFIFDITADSAGDLTVSSLRIDLSADADLATAATVSASLKDADTGDTLEAPVNVTFRSSSQAYLEWTDDFTVDAGTTRRIKLTLDTQSLLDEDGGVDDPLTFSIKLGSATSRGGLVWNDGYADVKWLGNVSSSTLSGNTLTY